MDQREDFSAYVAARWTTLVRSAVFLGCGVEEAQDVVQTTLMKSYVAWGRVSRAEDRDGYVYRVLLNAFRDSRRRRWWGERPTADLPDSQSPDAIAEVDVADAVHRALAGLDHQFREVVVLRYFANLGEQQTAAALRIPVGTVKSRLSRALKQLAVDDQLTDLREGSGS